LSALGDLKDKRVLDVGSNSGAYVIGAEMMGAAIAVGADLEPQRVAVATELARVADTGLLWAEYFSYQFPAPLSGDVIEGNGGKGGVFFEVADAAELAGFRNDYFDAINCLFLLNFLRDRDRVRPVDFLVGAASAFRVRSNPMGRINTLLLWEDDTLAAAVKKFVEESGGDEEAVANVAVSPAEETLMMQLMRVSINRDAVVRQLGWLDPSCCRPLSGGVDSPRLRALIRMLEVVKSGGIIQAESVLYGIPCRDYIDNNWIALYGLTSLSRFSEAMIPMVRTIDLLQIAARELQLRSGINITVTEIPGRLGNLASLFHVHKA
jgi:SAM-dependent methyltransferase